MQKIEKLKNSKVKDLSDKYCSILLTKCTDLKPEDIPESLISIKRLQLLLRRKSKEVFLSNKLRRVKSWA